MTDPTITEDEERVARAIYGAEADSDDLEIGSQEWCRRLARAAIAAMRSSEPMWREVARLRRAAERASIIINPYYNEAHRAVRAELNAALEALPPPPLSDGE